MIKKMFQELFVDSLASFICIALKEKAKTKINIKKSIRAFEDMWIYNLRESKKIDKRKS